ncbi:MAG: formylglycine-generating enzyme family protein [Saprospiraceae bacterium]|nr:formylglycine-generating enzyme family protein [Saprospiraceae bacterium]
MLLIPGAPFDMGGTDPEAEKYEKPVHTVYLPDFYLGEFPVTQDMWTSVMPEWPNPSYFRGPRRPVEQVSWYDAVVFCNRLSVYLGFEPCYFADAQYARPFGQDGAAWHLPNDGTVYLRAGTRGFRLPTESEWEYAAKGGPLHSPWLFAGSDTLKDVAWYRENSHGETKPVGMKAPNELGFFDMSGNVWEWCEDQWHDSYAEKGRPDDGSAWVDRAPGATRVVRGGSWLNYAQHCRATYRGNDYPAYRWNYYGFRLVFPLQSDGRPALAVR